MEYTLEQKFKALCQITRAAHFEWREAFMKMAPDMDPFEAVMKYWEVVGHDTAKAYLKKIDPSQPVLPQIAEQIVNSSLAMGENAVLIEGENEGEIYFEHRDCPWFEWHKRNNAIDEDQPGCDCWIKTILDDINSELGENISFETLSSIPSGSTSCKRRLFKQ